VKIASIVFWLMSIGYTVQAAPPPGCPSFTNENFTLTELTKIIRTESCQVKTIDDVLGLLPERMRSRLALFYKSKSLQAPHKTDYINPRAILSSVQGTAPNLAPAMMLSFNGEPSQRGYNRLEVLNLNPLARDGNVFNYHEIEFPEENTVGALSWTEAQTQIRISAANPAKCVQCHGTPARPVFQQYPNWEGAYGSRHTSGLTPEETAGLTSFINAHSNNNLSRYRHINPKRFETVYLSEISGKIILLNDKITFTNAEQTKTMNTDLSNYNGIRIASLIKKQPFYEAFKYAIVGAFRLCGNPTSFFTQPVLEKLKNNIDLNGKFSSPEARINSEKAFLQIASNMLQSTFGSYESIVGPKYDFSASPQERMTTQRQFWNNDEVLFGLAVDTLARQGYDRYIPEAAMLRLIFEGQGVDMSNWWSDLKRNTYRTNSGFGLNWDTMLRAQEPTTEWALPEYPNREERVKICEKLAPLSRAAMANFAVKDSPIQPPPGLSNNGLPSIFQKTCAKCHVENDIGPRIPFDDAAKFTVWLKDPRRLKRIKYKLFEAPELESMPPTRHLSAEEKAQLDNFLQQF